MRFSIIRCMTRRSQQILCLCLFYWRDNYKSKVSWTHELHHDHQNLSWPSSPGGDGFTPGQRKLHQLQPSWLANKTVAVSKMYFVFFLEEGGTIVGLFCVFVVCFAVGTGWFPVGVLYGLEKHYKLFSRLINVKFGASYVVAGYVVASSS